MRPSPPRRCAPDLSRSWPAVENRTAPRIRTIVVGCISVACLVSDPVDVGSPRPGEEHHCHPFQECSRVAEPAELHAPARRARGEASIVEESPVPVGGAREWPLLGDRAGLVERAIALEM